MSIIFIGSQLLTADLWADQIARLGSGVRSSVADNGQYDSVQALARAALAAAPPCFGLVVLGMGGFIAFEMLRQASARVTRLMLVSTLASNDTAQQTARRMSYLQLVESGKFESVIEERLPILISPQRRDDSSLVALARKMALETGPERFLRQQRAIMSRPDSRPGLAQIACPTIIAHGRQDGITTLAHQQEMLELIPNARLKILERCGHMLPLEQPQSFNELIRAWCEL